MKNRRTIFSLLLVLVIVVGLPWWVAASSIGTPGGSTPFPFTYVQEGAQFTNNGNVNNFTVTFPQTTAASGNTVWMIVAADGAQTITNPVGWTVDINQLQLSFSRLMVLHKTTAADTSATFSFSNSTMAVYFFEITGSHALDQSSTSSGAVASTLTFPPITPTLNSVVYAFSALTAGGHYPSVSAGNPAWQTMIIGEPTNSSDRFLYGFQGTGSAAHVATTPPQLGIPLLFGSSGMAWSTFSIL